MEIYFTFFLTWHKLSVHLRGWLAICSGINFSEFYCNQKIPFQSTEKKGWWNLILYFMSANLKIPFYSIKKIRLLGLLIRYIKLLSTDSFFILPSLRFCFKQQKTFQSLSLSGNEEDFSRRIICGNVKLQDLIFII